MVVDRLRYLPMVISATFFWLIIAAVDGNAVTTTSIQRSATQASLEDDAKVASLVSFEVEGAVVAETTSVPDIIYHCEGELVKTLAECIQLGHAGVGNGCYYNSLNFDTCQSLCDGIKVDSYLEVAQCRDYCSEYLDSACEKYSPTTTSTTISTTTTSTTSTPPISTTPCCTSTSESATPKLPTSASTAAQLSIVSTKVGLESGMSTKTKCRIGLPITAVALVAFFVTVLVYLNYRKNNLWCWYCKDELKCRFCRMAQNWFGKRYAIPGADNKRTVAQETSSSDEENTSMSSLPSSVEVFTPEAPSPPSPSTSHLALNMDYQEQTLVAPVVW